MAKKRKERESRAKRLASRKSSRRTDRSGRRSSREIRVALIGVGNVASGFVQAVYAKVLNGIWHDVIGGYKRDNIKIVAAFDIDNRKVGKDLSEAIFSEPNVTPKFSSVERTGITVQPGMVNYQIPRHLDNLSVGAENFLELLKAAKADVVLNLIPSGMADTSLDYAQAALKANCSFVNTTPEAIANDNSLKAKFATAKLVLVGDDLLSQFGGTAFHKGILDFMDSRGLRIEKSYQLDVGGGNETLNTINERVKFEKREIKTESISEEIPYKFETVAGTTDYVDYLGNNRTSYFWIQAKSLFDSEVKIDVYLRTNDAANAGNVLIDVIRAVSKAKESRRYGSPKEICDYGFKKLTNPALLRKAREEFFGVYG